jgi:hypothetical protein
MKWAFVSSGSFDEWVYQSRKRLPFLTNMQKDIEFRLQRLKSSFYCDVEFWK